MDLVLKMCFNQMPEYAKPRCIISDHDSGFVSNGLMSYLDRLQLPFNANAEFTLPNRSEINEVDIPCDM